MIGDLFYIVDLDNLIELYQDEFYHEIKQYEEFNKRGDYFHAKLHFDKANSANELIKNLRL